MVMFGVLGIKKDHLSYLKVKLEECEPKSDASIYIERCVRLLELEVCKKEPSQTLGYSEMYCDKFKTVGFDSHQCMILSYLFCNATMEAGILAKLTKLDRGKVYRTLTELQKMGVVGKAGIHTSNFYIQDRKKPFKHMIIKKEQELKHLIKSQKEFVNASN